MMISFIEELGNTETALTKTLWAIVEDDDEYYAYCSLMQNSTENVPPSSLPSHLEKSVETVVKTVKIG